MRFVRLHVRSCVVCWDRVALVTASTRFEADDALNFVSHRARVPAQRSIVFTNIPCSVSIQIAPMFRGEYLPLGVVVRTRTRIETSGDSEGQPIAPPSAIPASAPNSSFGGW